MECATWCRQWLIGRDNYCGECRRSGHSGIAVSLPFGQTQPMDARAVRDRMCGLFCHLLAQPVPGVGIAIPTFAPPFITAIVALIFAETNVAAIAYISGSIGTLIGADLLNLDKLQSMGAPVASIGGAGTFDGIFLTGILAVLFASFSLRK